MNNNLLNIISNTVHDFVGADKHVVDKIFQVRLI